MMVVADIPDFPQYVYQTSAQTETARRTAQKINRTILVCLVVQPPDSQDPEGTALNSLSPTVWVRNYFRREGRPIVEGPARITVLQNPAHGRVNDVGDDDYFYLPRPDYIGRDRAVLRVEMTNLDVRIMYSFHVVKMVNQATESLCPEERIMGSGPDL